MNKNLFNSVCDAYKYLGDKNAQIAEKHRQPRQISFLICCQSNKLYTSSFKAYKLRDKTNIMLILETKKKHAIFVQS